MKHSITAPVSRVSIAIAMCFFSFLAAFTPAAQASDDFGNSCAEALHVQRNSTISGAIDAAGDYDYFKVDMPWAGTLFVYTTGTTDTYGHLLDSDCNDIATDDNSGGGAGNFYISRHLRAGTYYVAVRHASPAGTGAYRLAVSNWSGPANVLLMLDNSGSMNFPAYPDPYNPDVGGISAGTVVPAIFQEGCQVSVQVSSGNDDAEERVRDQAIYACGFDWRTNADLDLSKDDYCSYWQNSKTCSSTACANFEEQVTGIRFQNVAIPKTVNGVPVVITSARIVFTAYATSETGNSATLHIAGEAADDAAGFTTDTGNISARPETAAKVTWAAVGPWTVDTTTNAETPDLKDIVQEIIDRPGWAAGNDMVFKITGEAGSRRRAYSYDTSASKAPQLVITYEPCESHKYYGYFDPDARYVYTAGRFVRDSGGEWSGNFLNWLTMRRVDVIRKALMGGQRTCESCGGLAILQGEDPAQTMRYWQVYYDNMAGTQSPYAGGAWYGMKDGRLYVKSSQNPWDSPDAVFNIAVAIDQAVEPDLFCSDGDEAGNPCGVLQKAAQDVRFGTIWFDASGNDGGRVSNPVGTNIRDIINDVQCVSMETSTPLAETLYTAMKYFEQDPILPSGYSSSALPLPAYPGGPKDPFYYEGYPMPWAKSTVLMITDGVPTSDRSIPEAVRDYDGDANEANRVYDGDGSDYLDDVALYAHVNDLREDISSRNSLDLYSIYAFGKNPDAELLVKEAAMSGGFLDINCNHRPDGYNNDGCFDCLPAAERLEWDKNGDAVPDTYYDATDGITIEARVQEAIDDIISSLEVVCGAVYDDDGDGYSFCNGDCNDFDGDVNPDAPELCNGIDDNCNGLTDEGACGETTTTVAPTTTTSVPPTTTTTAPPVDTDGDGIADGVDNCPAVANPQQLDADTDGIGDVCDPEPGCGGCGQSACETGSPASTTTTAPLVTTTTTTVPPDTDGDGIADATDNCPSDCNAQQLDADTDGIGDVCDPSPGCGGCGQAACETVCTP